MSVEDISSATNLHVNTIRTHLEVLRAAGRIQRSRGDAVGRGRPRWLYSAPDAADDPYRSLAAELSRALTAAEGAAVADAAAERWRRADNVVHELADTPDEAVAVAADALEKLGFEVDVSPVGDAVYLGRCPYASLVQEYPVICDIHARALEQVLAETGQPVGLRSLDVFPRPGVCVAHLRRGDVEPGRVIEGSEPPKGSTPDTGRQPGKGATKKSRRQA